MKLSELRTRIAALPESMDDREVVVSAPTVGALDAVTVVEDPELGAWLVLEASAAFDAERRCEAEG